LHKIKPKYQYAMKKVFHIITHFGMGGAERVAINIAESDNRDIEYHIVEVMRSHSEFSMMLMKEMDDSHIYYHRAHIPDIKFHFVFERFAALCFPFWFIFIFLKYKPDAIHSHTEVPDLSVYIFFKLLPFLKKRCKLVRTIHNTKLWTGQKEMGAKVERFFVNSGTNVSISQSVRSCYQNVYRQPTPIIYNGVAPVSQQKYEGIVPDKINVLFAGRFEPQKGISTLIRIIKSMEEDKTYFFHIIGDGSLKNEIYRNLSDGSNVSVCSTMSGLSSYMSSFDYMIMPSEFEGLSILSIEASFAKLPVIINNCSGLKDTLPETWPLKVENNSIDDYKRIFQQVLPMTDRTCLAQVSYDYVSEHFSIKKMQAEYEKLY